MRRIDGCFYNVVGEWGSCSRHRGLLALSGLCCCTPVALRCRLLLTLFFMCTACLITKPGFPVNEFSKQLLRLIDEGHMPLDEAQPQAWVAGTAGTGEWAGK